MYSDVLTMILFSWTVADASIIPIQLSAHLSSTVYGIAEKVCLSRVAV